MSSTNSKAEIARYRNPYFDRRHPTDPRRSTGPEFYETEAQPTEHRGYLIYERIRGHVWDVVKNGWCVTQRAGFDGACRAIDELLSRQAEVKNAKRPTKAPARTRR